MSLDSVDIGHCFLTRIKEEMHILRNMANFLLKRAEVLKICTFKENLTKYCQICLFTLLTKTMNFETTIIFCFNKHQNSNAHFKRNGQFSIKKGEIS